MSELSGAGTFYDKVAAKFGEYFTGVHSHTEYRTGRPEAVFEEKLIGVGGPDKIALDAGSGDGRFTLFIAKYFGLVVGIEMSRGMLAIAQRKQAEQAVGNVRFEARDASATSFPDASFDVVFSRRGPTKYREFRRLVKSGGSVLHVGIGEQDALELKQVFGRGQGFDYLGTSWLGRSRALQETAGLTIVYAEEFLYDEYYPTYGELETFLQGVPIFEDFDPAADRELLEEYAAQARTPRGIHLLRHRYVTVAMNPRRAASPGECDEATR
jgi:SAM-dependent methyltransferase